VGVLSDSYDTLGGAAAGVASGDLPAGVIVLDDTVAGSDEGRAMMEIVHDVAPGAGQAFHTAFTGQAGFASGIGDLVAAGAHVIVDDVYYRSVPMFQDGIIAQAVDAAAESGVAYFSSAGNLARRSYEDAYRAGSAYGAGAFGAAFDGGTAHDFDPGGGVDEFQAMTIPAGGLLDVTLQWDSPFASVCGGCPGSANDIDIYVLDDPPTTVLASSTNSNTGGDAVETVSFANGGGAPLTVNIMIVNFSGPDPGLVKYVRFGSATPNEYDTMSSTSYGHSCAAGGVGVGAAGWFDTPAFGQDPPLLESSSSAGSTPILFDTTGALLGAPEVRDQPEIVGPDGGGNTFFGAPYACWPAFFGTSAAAPHAAGLAALMLERNGTLTTASIYSILEGTADDMLAPDYDDDSGYGLVQGTSAMEAARSRDALVTSISDVNSNGIDDVAVMLAGSIDVLVFDGGGGLLHQYSLDPSFVPVDIVSLGDFAGTPADEIAVLGKRRSDGAGRVFINDGSTGASVSLVFNPPSDPPIGLVAIPNFGGSGAPEVGIVARNKATGVPRLFIKDAASSALLRLYGVGNVWEPRKAVLVPNFGGTGDPEIAWMLHRVSDGVTRVRVMDVNSGAQLGNHFIAGIHEAIDCEIMTVSAGATAAPEVTVLTRKKSNGKILVWVLDASSGAEIARLDYGKVAVPLDLEVIDSIGGTAAQDLGVLERFRGVGDARMRFRDPLNGNQVGLPTSSNQYFPLDVIIVPSVGGSAAPDVGTFERRASDGVARVRFKDASTNAVTANLFLP
jgi:hypothetical protein